ncbi:MAG: NAD(+) synthase [Solirubrobacterales bacterium]
MVNEIVIWLKEQLESSGSKGFITGNSGGIDSAVVLALCKLASKNTIGVIMPCGNISEDERYARITAEKFDIETIFVDLMQPFEAMKSAIGEDLSSLSSSNLKPRLRMASLYAIAQNRGYIVVGTGNLSEATMGYFTKWGDGAHDINPIRNLCKSEVRILARELGVPEEIIEKAPSAGLWEGQTDEEEMKVLYKEIDEYILNGSTNERAQKIIEEQYDKTEHKRIGIKAFPVERDPVYLQKN